jgi:hypothetical protein
VRTGRALCELGVPFEIVGDEVQRIPDLVTKLIVSMKTFFIINHSLQTFPECVADCGSVVAEVSRAYGSMVTVSRAMITFKSYN